MFVGSEGVTLTLTVRDNNVPVNLVGSTVTVVLKTGSTRVEKPATIGGVTGTCTVTLTKEDLAAAGEYAIQPIVEYSDGREFPGSIRKFSVEDRL